MQVQTHTLTTMDGQRVSIGPFDLKSVKDIPNGVEVITHAGDKYKFPISRYVFDLMMTVDARQTSNKVTVVDPIR